MLRVYLNPHVDLELTGEAARAYAAADEQGQRDMVNRLLADHIEVAGAGEAGVAAGSEIMTVQALRVEEIGEVVRPRIGRAGCQRWRSAGIWSRSGLISRLPGRGWYPAMAVRRPAGSALSWRS